MMSQIDDDDESQDYDGVESAYGYSIGETVTYKGMLRARIVAFGNNYIAYVNLWDPDLASQCESNPGGWSGIATKISINDVE